MQMDVGENDQMEVVTDKKEPSPEVRFKYVYIPCDMSQPVEEREMVTDKDGVMSCLIDTFRPHFQEKSGLISAEQKKTLKANLELEMKKSAAKSGSAPNEVTNEMVDKMSTSTLVDVVPLVPAVPAAKYVSVTLYVDDKGSVKNLPINERATGLVFAAGGNVTVAGDAFVARAYDNEAEDMQRFDFTLAELNANSEWFQEAWRILRTLEGTREGVPADKAAASASIEAKCAAIPTGDGHAFVPSTHPQMTADQRLTAAEQIRTVGNALFKDGKLEEALSAYLKAQRYLRVHPPLEGERAVASRVSACLNGAMCWLKLEQHGHCIGCCNAVLKMSGHASNAKALFRKGSALRSLQMWEDAVNTLRAASAAAPGDAAVKTELAKAEKDLNKHVYGW